MSLTCSWRRPDGCHLIWCDLQYNHWCSWQLFFETWWHLAFLLFNFIFSMSHDRLWRMENAGFALELRSGGNPTIYQNWNYSCLATYSQLGNTGLMYLYAEPFCRILPFYWRFLRGKWITSVHVDVYFMQMIMARKHLLSLETLRTFIDISLWISLWTFH